VRLLHAGANHVAGRRPTERGVGPAGKWRECAIVLAQHLSLSAAYNGIVAAIEEVLAAGVISCYAQALARPLMVRLATRQVNTNLSFIYTRGVTQAKPWREVCGGGQHWVRSFPWGPGETNLVDLMKDTFF